MRIGFIGTGIMGGPMAGHLAKAGHHVVAWNRSADKLVPLAALGVEAAASPIEAARDVDVLVSMLADGPTTEAVLIEGGVIAAMPQGSLLIDQASTPVATAKSLSAEAAMRQIGFVDAPVSGGQRGAEQASLTIMAGGSAADLERALPVLTLLGRVTHMGEAGCGQLAKICNQLIVANTIATVSEAMILAERGGVAPSALRQALSGGFADSTILQQHGQRMIEGNFVPGGRCTTQLKDCRTATAQAEALELELPVTKLVRDLYAQQVEQGGGDQDHSALYLLLKRLNGL
jgi:2-hydroxy-3-oxopropionate reductase